MNGALGKDLNCSWTPSRGLNRSPDGALLVWDQGVVGERGALSGAGEFSQFSASSHLSINILGTGHRRTAIRSLGSVKTWYQ